VTAIEPARIFVRLRQHVVVRAPDLHSTWKAPQHWSVSAMREWTQLGLLHRRDGPGRRWNGGVEPLPERSKHKHPNTLGCGNSTRRIASTGGNASRSPMDGGSDVARRYSWRATVVTVARKGIGEAANG
jgi:hypothetical protein